jgi:hypothetical protein
LVAFIRMNPEKGSLVDDLLGIYSRNCAGKVSYVNPLIVVVFILHWCDWGRGWGWSSF